jgi:hypothetical protein
MFKLYRTLCSLDFAALSNIENDFWYDDIANLEITIDSARNAKIDDGTNPEHISRG